MNTRHPHPDGALLRLQEAADLLAVSTRTLWSLANRGDIRCVRIGRAIRFDPVDLRAFVEKQKSRAG